MSKKNYPTFNVFKSVVHPLDFKTVTAYKEWARQGPYGGIDFPINAPSFYNNPRNDHLEECDGLDEFCDRARAVYHKVGRQDWTPASLRANGYRWLLDHIRIIHNMEWKDFALVCEGTINLSYEDLAP